MGNLEKEVTKRRRRGELRNAVLMTIAAAGVLGVALVAPNVLYALKKMGISDFRGPRRKELINRARDRLIDAELLTRDEKGYLHITPKGQAQLNLLEAHNYQIKKPKRWDKKWRLLVFDIPEHRRGTRTKVRNTLQAIGFRRMQDSVWIYPYDCEDLVALLKADFKIGKDLIYLIAEAVENDSNLRKQFGLPLE